MEKKYICCLYFSDNTTVTSIIEIHCFKYVLFIQTNKLLTNKDVSIDIKIVIQLNVKYDRLKVGV